MIGKLILLYFTIGFVYVCAWCSIPSFLSQKWKDAKNELFSRSHYQPPRRIIALTLMLVFLWIMLIWPYAIYLDMKEKGRKP